jgi:membrane protein EpsK
LIKHYGSGSYGLIALAGFLTQYVGLISRCVGNSIARFLNVALNQNDWKQANEIFSTALVAKLGFIVLQLPFFALGVWKLDWIIDFPPEMGGDFRILVICNIAVFFISMITGVLRTPIQAANRLDLSSSLHIARLTLRLILLFFLIQSVGARLWLIGVVDLGLSLVNSIVIIAIYRRLARNLVFKWKHVTRKWIRPVLNMAGWSMVTALGGCLLVKSDVWMINRFVSKEMAGIYAALLVWPNYLKQVSKQLAAVLAPVYLIDYAKGDHERVARLSLSSAKLLGCFVAVCAGGLWVVAEPLLELWLGSGAHVHVVLFRMMVVYLTYTIGESVLWQIYVTLNKVHFTGMVTLSMGLLNIVLSLLLIQAGFGALGVAAATVFSVILSSSLAIPLGVCREFKVPYKAVWANYVSATFMLLLSFAAATVALSLSETSFFLAGAIYTVLLAAGGYCTSRFIFSEAEMGAFKQVLKKIQQIIPKAGQIK